MLTEPVPRELVDEVMDRAGRREKRVQPLPVRGVVCSVLALCLFFSDGFEDVVPHTPKTVKAGDTVNLTLCAP